MHLATPPPDDEYDFDYDAGPTPRIGSVAELAAEAVAAPNPFVGVDLDTILRSFAVWGRGVAGHPVEVVKQVGKLVVDSARAMTGPPIEKTDRRFAHPAWHASIPHRVIAREYLVLRDALYDSVERSRLEGDDAERARFAAALLVESFAPTNNPLLNPAAAERMWRTRGSSLFYGASNLVDDVRRNGGMPAVTRRDAFVVGKDLACTPGEVIYRSDICELIQFKPQTDQVHHIPVLMVPSPVNKYYFLDLAPGRSLVQYTLQAGIQFFTISWRNPTSCQSNWGLDTYAQAVKDALAVVRDVCGSEETNLLGVCAGGLINAGVLADQLNSAQATVPAATYLVSGIDSSWPTTFGALATTRAANHAVRRVRRKGMMPGRDISRAFAWMRPNELLWGLWVNNYVLGKNAPSTDILYWNSDLTNLPAKFHGEQVQLLRENPFAHPNEATVLGNPVDLTKIEVDSYFLGAVDDHIVPWQACFRSAKLFGGTARFVAASGGHIQCLISPPTSAKARFRVSEGKLPDEPEDWMAASQEHVGTWWADWRTWLVERSGELQAAPPTTGSASYPPIQPAPGRYIHQSA
jgi:polyhydroxyalkanoate synthase